MNATAVLNPLSDSSASAIADWLELAVMSSSRRRLSPGKGHEILAGSGSAADEVDVALAFGVLSERCGYGLQHYPFRFSRLGLERDPDADISTYAFLLLLASATIGSVHLPDEGVAARLFERLVRGASISLFGPMTKAVRFGTPPEPDRPVGFSEAIAWLGAKVGVRVLPLSGSALRRGDGGVDVVAWRSYDDGRPSAPVAAIQSTFEGDLRGKSLEIAANELDRWLAIARAVPVLASPIDAIADPDLFVELGARVVMLDRWRLLKCLESQTASAEIQDWATARIGQLEL